MTKKFKLALHLFRRDLRLQDNTALIEALKQSDAVIPCFIFDERQVKNNPYKSDNSLTFMVNTLQEMDAALVGKQSQLSCFHGIAESVIESLLKTLPIEAVFCNRDYTPFSRKRDAAIEAVCLKNEVSFHAYADALLHEPDTCLKSDGKPYTVFTPFFRNALKHEVKAPEKYSGGQFYQAEIALSSRTKPADYLPEINPNLLVKGGRKEALALLKHLPLLSHYDQERDFPAKLATSQLSAHLKFGTVSPREVYTCICRALNPYHPLIRQLHWRDFFTHIAYHFPHVFKGAFHQAYDKLSWENDDEAFKAWCEGKTGFPIVDAGMRELNATGSMHNRLRMITASFLTKDLHIDWRWGERYFASKLVDYDPALNNGNWQWAASTGCDAQPYFRIFNPWLQQAKFDPDALYIKKWVPELASYSSKLIHSLQDHVVPNYPAPMLSHAVESQKAKALYKAALASV